MTRTLVPETPTVLICRRRLAPRALAFFPLVVLMVGVALAAAPDPAAVADVGYLLIAVGIVVEVANIAVGDPRRIVLRFASISPRARTLDEVTNLLGGLCAGNGLSVPRVLVVADPSPNSMALGWNEREATLIVTTGLLEQCGRVELEGVIAHELSHLKRGDVRDAAFATVACGALALVSGIAARAVDWLLDPAREASADLGASSMTRFPPGLAQALSRAVATGRHSTDSRAAWSRLTAPLWLVGGLPVESKARPGALRSDERIGLLAEL